MSSGFPEIIIRKVENGYFIAVDIPERSRRKVETLKNDIISQLQRARENPEEHAAGVILGGVIGSNDTSGLKVFVAMTIDEALAIIKREFTSTVDVPDVFKGLDFDKIGDS